MTKQMEGTRVDIGGIQLYCEELGEHTDSPVIVFDSGYGVPTKRWSTIKMSKICEACCKKRK